MLVYFYTSIKKNTLMNKYLDCIWEKKCFNTQSDYLPKFNYK